MKMNDFTLMKIQKQLQRIRAAMPDRPKKDREMKLRFSEPERSGDDVLTVKGLKKQYGGRILFSGADTVIRRGEKVFLLGPNGCGKTTFLSCVTGRETADEGIAYFGVNVKSAYFEQTQRELMQNKSVLQEIYDRYPALTVPEIRKYLAAFNFRNDDIDKNMSGLSGGERARVALLEMILAKPNFLILDEPTNHLDFASREVLEDALAGFEGTVLCVSHDRYFVNRLASRILYFGGENIISSDGNYDDYISALQDGVSGGALQKKKTNDYKERKERESRERKRQARMQRIEEELDRLREEKNALVGLMSEPETASDYAKILDINEKIKEIDEKTESLETEWLNLTEEAEKN